MSEYNIQKEYFLVPLRQYKEMLPLGKAIQDSLSNVLTLKYPSDLLASDLTEAFVTCDVEAIERCLSLGVDPNLTLPGNHKPITYIISHASSADWDEVVRILLEAGADPNTRDPKGNPLLMLLMPSANSTVIELAVRKGADVEIKGPTGETPLLEAVHYRQVESVKLLLKKGANPNHISSDGNSVLMWAAGRSNGIGMQRSHKCVKLLLEHGADPNYKNPRGYTALMAASLIREADHVKTLLSAGADPDLTDLQGETALMKAVVTGAENVVQKLLEYKSNINIKCNAGWSAPMASKSEDILLSLLCNGTDFKLCDDHGYTVLHHQAKKDQPESCQLCLEYGAELDGKNKNGETPLQIAVRSRCRKTNRLLMSFGANINNRNSKGISILHDAIISTDYFGSTNIFPIIDTPEKYVRFKFESCDGYDSIPDRTMLLIEHLLNDGADVNHKGEGGVTPLMLASAIGDISLIRILLNASAEVDTMDEGGRIALSYACKWGHSSVVKLLLSHDTPVNIEDEEGNLPVFYAAQWSHVDVLLLLMIELALYYNCTK